MAGLSASTDSNYVQAFDVPGNYAPCCSHELLKKLTAASEKTGIEFRAGNILSADSFYDTNQDGWKSWARMNILAVEMEAAALYMNAAYLGANALAIMTISDHFVTREIVSSEDREKNFTDMMKLALETVTA